MNGWRATAAIVLTLCTACSGCDEDALVPAPSDGGVAPGNLSQEQAKAVVARVGDDTITLGDYAAVLERMNQFDRLRYQTQDRRRALLDEMIDVELLAQEARRRGLDKRADVQEAIRQILRDAILAEARSNVLPPGGYSAAEVRAYYDANADQFQEPERRRVSVIVMGDEAKAAEVLEQSKAGKAWGELYFDHSLDAPPERPEHAPADLAGDLGIVGPVGDEKGANAAVPESVRAAVFQIDKVGAVHGELVKDAGRFYIVRLAGLTQGHTRSVEEADRVIRMRLMQDAVRQREHALEADLRKRYPVQIDRAALAEVKLPAALDGYKPFWDEGGAHEHEGAGGGATDGAGEEP
jgi:hypothetical protein